MKYILDLLTFIGFTCLFAFLLGYPLDSLHFTISFKVRAEFILILFFLVKIACYAACAHAINQDNGDLNA